MGGGGSSAYALPTRPPRHTKEKSTLYYYLSYILSLSGDVRRMQFAILDRSPREMSQTDRIHPRYFLSRVRVSIRPTIFLYVKKPQTTVARPAAVDRRSVGDEQLNLNGRKPFSPSSSVPRAQRENVVAECSDHGSNPVLGTKGLLLINPRNIISNIMI